MATKLFAHPLTKHPQDVFDALQLLFKGYAGRNLNGVVAPLPVWSEMTRQLNSGQVKMNGCGAANHISEYVPETIWGLCITPICNIHDVCYELCETTEDCDESNRLFLRNMVVYINNNSNWLMRRLRRHRAMTYYSFVHEARKTHCGGYRHAG